MLKIPSLRPRWKKIRKKQKIHKMYFKKNKFQFNEYGIKVLSNYTLNIKKLNLLKQLLKLYIKKSGKIFINATNIYPVTKKSSETRMGSGVGKISDWYIKIFAGSILFEFSTNFDKKFINKFFIKLAYKFKVPIKLVFNQSFKL